MNTSYTVTHRAHGDATTRWFSTLEDAKRYARGIVRLGYAPAFTAYPESDHTKGRPINPLAFRVWQFFRGVDA